MATAAYSTLVEDDLPKDQEFSTKDKDSLINTDNTTSRKESIPLRTQQSIRQETICGFDGLKVIVLSSVVVSLAITVAMVITIVIGNPQVPPHGAVATGNTDCSKVAVSILQQGGSAVDAAIAAMLCIGVVNAQSAGIGGGGFMLVLDAESASYSGIDFRESAPANITVDMYDGKPGASLLAGMTVGVPGELRGMRQAWLKFGKLDWDELFTPAINLARDGFTVRGSLASEVAKIDPASMSENFRKVYAPGRGGPVKTDDIIKRPEYANLLQRIASNGLKEFYGGDVAQEIVDIVSANGGNMTLDDLASYRARFVTPITVTYRDYNLVSLPVPSGGPMVLTMMNIMELFNVTEKDMDSSLYYHRFLEALKFVKAEEIGLGEAAVSNYSQTMISKSNAELLYANITDETTHPPDYYFTYAQSILKTQGTSHISVIDTDNNMVAVSSTVNTAFGALLMTPSGVILNNEMTDFDWPGKTSMSNSSTANYIAPGRRPQSSMAPLMGRNSTTACSRRFASGGEGGSNITAATVDVVMKLLAFKTTLFDATQQLTRVSTPLVPNTVEYEAALSHDIVTDLREKGHNTQIMRKPDTNVNTVMKENDKMFAESDQRRVGSGARQY